MPNLLEKLLGPAGGLSDSLKFMLSCHRCKELASRTETCAVFPWAERSPKTMVKLWWPRLPHNPGLLLLFTWKEGIFWAALAGTTARSGGTES